jgi:hypothetical protein
MVAVRILFFYLYGEPFSGGYSGLGFIKKVEPSKVLPHAVE